MFAGPASAASPDTCRIADAGLPSSVEAYLDAAAHCLSQPPEGVTLRRDVEAGLADRVAERRQSAGAGRLEIREGLNRAARLHAIDMAARDYAGHSDSAGRGHLERARTLDRTGLYASMGGNVTTLRSDNPRVIDRAIASESVNRDNIERQDFTHMGVGAAEANGRLYVVQLFARLDGELNREAPVRIAGSERLQPAFAQRSMRLEGVALSAEDGAVIAVSRNPLVSDPGGQARNAYLVVAARDGDTVYSLRGPSMATAGDD